MVMPLLALGSQAVHQQGKVDVVALGAEFFGFSPECGQLVVEQLLRFPQQAADEGAFAIVHAATGDEAQKVLLLL